MSATKCIERSRREHEDLVAEFHSLMSGVEATLQSTGMKFSRMSGDDLFFEIKRALHPLGNDRAPYRRPETSICLRERPKPNCERKHRGRTR